eukprot:GHVO01021515.1.p1 GENE.GHVO01021515.1~~GHVO01021515.1.p1  ORF type:complete len:260 (-),score=26.02 GHVO01021515.1:369-1052(-)
MMIFYSATTPMSTFLTSFSKLWLWGGQLIYLAYALYLDTVSLYAGGRNQISFIARSILTVYGEVIFFSQLTSCLIFWLRTYPRDIDGVYVFKNEIQPHGLGLLIMVIDYICRKMDISKDAVKSVSKELGLSLLICLPISVASSTYNTGFAYVNTIIMTIVFCAASAIALSHKMTFAIENPRYVLESLRTFFGILYIFASKADRTSLSEGGSPPPRAAYWPFADARPR